MNKPTLIGNRLNFWRVRPWGDHQMEHDLHYRFNRVADHFETLTKTMRRFATQLDTRP